VLTLLIVCNPPIYTHMATTPKVNLQSSSIETTSRVKQPRSLIVEFLLGGLSTSCACLFSNPFEVVKTRMQVQGEQGAQTRAFRNSFHALYTIARNEGLRGIQRGIAPAIGYQLCMNGTRLGSYGPIKRIIGATPEKSFYFMRTILAGATAGAISSIVGSPFFLVKVRLQTQASGRTVAVGTQHGYSNMSFVGVLRHIISSEGLSGLFRGVTSGMMRVSVGSASQLSSYDAIRRELAKIEYLQRHEFLSRCASSFVAGVVVVTAMNPFDVLATRMYNQKVGERYTSNIDCLAQILRTEGPRGLFKGWFAHYARLGPHTILTFIFWEQAKIIATKYGY